VLDFWQAQVKAREQMVQHAHQGSAQGGTVASAFDDYLRFLEHNRKSIEDTRYRTNAHILPKLGHIELAALSADAIRKWLVDLANSAPRTRTRAGIEQKHVAVVGAEAKRRRRASANRTLSILKAGLNRAWRDGKIASNAEWARVEPFRSVGAARVRYLSIAEAQRLLNACDPDFRDLVQAALQTGCRYGELAALQVHDFNSDAGTLAIRQSKTGKARHVVLTDEGAALFRQLCAGRSGGETVLRRADGQPWRKSNQCILMTQSCRRAKIEPAIGFHALRHTWASLAVMNGVPLMVVARNLGHSTTRMVESHYGHLAQSYIADAIRAGAPRFGFRPDAKVAALTRR
jgi:integrase